MGRYIFHPALLDSALQPVMTLLDATGAAQDTYLPVRTARCRVHARPEPGRRLWSRAVRASAPPGEDPVEFDVLVGDDAGRPVATIEGFRLRKPAADSPEMAEQKARPLLHGVEWTELEPLPRPPLEQASWLVVTGSPLGSRLRAALAEGGSRAVLVQPGDGYRGRPQRRRRLSRVGENLAARPRGRAVPASCPLSPSGVPGHAGSMRNAFVHDAVVVMEPEGDVGAPGAAVTAALCGHWEHPPPCPLAPHRCHADREPAGVRLRILFAAEPDLEETVRERIDRALRSGRLSGPDGVVTRWRLRASGRGDLVPEEAAHARRLIGA
ncbi:polyketide synthase dehydratase domain-containing protein [Streptosporangium fragile]